VDDSTFDSAPFNPTGQGMDGKTGSQKGTHVSVLAPPTRRVARRDTFRAVEEEQVDVDRDACYRGVDGDEDGLGGVRVVIRGGDMLHP